MDDRLTRFALLGYALFGVATAVDAFIPVGCGASPLSSCGVDLNHLNVDDCLTGVAVLALFMAAVCAHICSVQKLSWTPALVVCFMITIIWSTCGLAFFVVHFSTRPDVPLQHLMLTLTSAVAFTVPAMITLTRYRIGLDRITY